MREIELSRGYVALVDDEDYEWISQFSWHASSGMCRTGKCSVYAVRWLYLDDGSRKIIGMHRELTNAPADMQVDHINGNSLDNRKSNLRVCTPAQNNKNMPRNSRNTSGYKGVHWCVTRQRWVATIKIDGRRKWLGAHKTIELAAKAYADASQKYHGDFGRTE